MIFNLKRKYSAQNNQCHVNYYRFKRYSSEWFVFRTLEAITAQPLPVTRIPDQQGCFCLMTTTIVVSVTDFAMDHRWSLFCTRSAWAIFIQTTTFLLLAETRHSSFHIATYHIATIAVRKQRTDGDDFDWYYLVLHGFIEVFDRPLSCNHIWITDQYIRHVYTFSHGEEIISHMPPVY